MTVRCARHFTVVVFNVTALTRARFGWFIALNKGKETETGEGKVSEKKQRVNKSREPIVLVPERREKQKNKIETNGLSNREKNTLFLTGADGVPIITIIDNGARGLLFKSPNVDDTALLGFPNYLSGPS